MRFIKVVEWLSSIYEVLGLNPDHEPALQTDVLANFKFLQVIPEIVHVFFCFIWVCNLAPDIEKGTSAESFRERVLWKIFWPKKDRVTGDGRKLHREEVNELCLPNIRAIKFKKNEEGRASGVYGGEGRCVQGFGGET